MHRSNLFIVALVFLYSLNLAPMMFESFTSDRTWAAHPPESFHMFTGQYGHRTEHYWRVVSPLASLAFVAALVFNWSVGERRGWLVAALILYLAVQASTMTFFVPEQERLIASAGALSSGVLKSRADRWLLLNYGRMVVGSAAFICMMRAAFAPRP